MRMLLAAGLFFIGIHIIISSSPLRGVITGRIGERAYQAAFSLLSLAGLGWLIWSYIEADRLTLGYPPAWLLFLSVLTSMAGLWLAFMGILSPNPTTIGQEGLLKSATRSQGIVRVTRHPFMVGFALWALAHAVLNPDTASLIFFGTFLVLAGLGPWLIDRKKARAMPDHWPHFASATSIIPFQAILRGRNQFVSAEIGWWRPLAALLAVALLFWFHGSLFGAALF